MAERLVPFHDEQSQGAWSLIGAGGESVVFGDPTHQRVLKLLSPAGRARFGWVLDQDRDQQWGLRKGALAAALRRYHLAEQLFPSGLEIEAIGAGCSFLLLSQPFFVGSHPEPSQLAAEMQTRGWEPHRPSSQLSTLLNLSWKKGHQLATDVRPENVILAESDGKLYPFDFIVGQEPS
ncbi:hypothetical protein [Roseibacillus ishigakijimensis]|uniref:Uncharacterized protein n=1 Tax=Roseibacillus ishigakijimensis TaxID=454146 RepID=A0A934RRE8_9BACT|nr:hypothetical protein [Roseibacillus ishigakijimensis]MBK1833664.1 hypothetical protein [Roseibacillus ishigakijimensis]